MKFYDQFFTVGRYIILKQYRIHDDLQLMNILKWNIDTSRPKTRQIQITNGTLNGSKLFYLLQFNPTKENICIVFLD